MSLFDRLFGRSSGPSDSPDSPDAPGASGPPPKPLLKPDGTPYDLALYAYDSCPYCRRVERALSQLGIAVERRNTLRDRTHRDDLIDATGRATVPCLFIDGTPMHESADIVRWLRARAEEQPAR